MARREPTAPRDSFAFDGILEPLTIGGRLIYWVLFLPARLQRREPFAAGRRLRMVGRANGEKVSMAWQRSGGRHYVMFGRGAAKALGLALGDRIRLEFTLVSDTVVDVPPEIRELTRQDRELGAVWKALTPGARRGLGHLVRSVRSPELRAQRAVDLLEAARRGELPRPPRRRRAH